MFIVFDLDGCLADTSQRDHKYLYCLERGAPHKRAFIDWDAYFDECDSDLPIEHALFTLKAIGATGQAVSIWTARSELVRDKTVAWLARHGVNAEGAGLRMRPVGDHRPDTEIKAEWAAAQRPDLVFEDRDRVVKMWRELGIPCYQVAPGDF